MIKTALLTWLSKYPVQFCQHIYADHHDELVIFSNPDDQDYFQSGVRMSRPLYV